MCHGENSTSLKGLIRRPFSMGTARAGLLNDRYVAAITNFVDLNGSSLTHFLSVVLVNNHGSYQANRS